VSWTQEDMDRVVHLTREGYSLAQVGVELGRSRDAVASIIHRKLRDQLPKKPNGNPYANKTPPKRGAAPKAAPKREATKAPKIYPHNIVRTAERKAAEPVFVEPVAPPAPVEPRRVTLMQLRDFGECKYAVEGAGADTLFCGLPSTSPVSSWCAHHHRLVWAPAAQRRRVAA
jgi:hypothetical protein